MKQKLYETDIEKIEADIKLAPIVNYLIQEANIIGMENETVGALVVDAVDLLQVMVPKGIFNVPLIIYRTGNIFRLYNHEMILSGAVKVAQVGEGKYTYMVYGKEMLKREGFNSSKFLNCLSFDINSSQQKMNKKFYRLPVVVNKKNT